MIDPALVLDSQVECDGEEPRYEGVEEAAPHDDVLHLGLTGHELDGIGRYR